jgi:hypothetical protein
MRCRMIASFMSVGTSKEESSANPKLAWTPTSSLVKLKPTSTIWSPHQRWKGGESLGF